MGFSNNGLPLGPNGRFPLQRIGNVGTVKLRPVMSMERQYLKNEVATLPTQEMEYSSVVNAAKNHLLFGEVKKQSNMKKMGGGFQREMDRKKLMARPMPGHTGDEVMEVREMFVTNLGPKRMMGSSNLTGLGESLVFGPRSVGYNIGVGNSGRSAKGWMFRLFGIANKQISNYGLGSGRDQNF